MMGSTVHGAPSHTHLWMMQSRESELWGDRHLGRLALLAKFDNASAYRVVPVHPDERMLLGMVWRDQLYVDGALPFGLRSAPKLFTALADGLL